MVPKWSDTMFLPSMQVTALVNSTAQMYQAAMGLLKILEFVEKFRLCHKFLVLSYPH